MLDAYSSPLLDAVTAAGTLAAAVFAAVSTWISRGAAKAANATVEEARLARRNEILPRFVLEKAFLDFSFYWPHKMSLNGEPVYLARKHEKDVDPSPPVFTLSNFGLSPAYELDVIFELIDHNGDLVIPDDYRQCGLSDGAYTVLTDGQPIPTMIWRTSEGKGGALPLYRKYGVKLPHSLPGHPISLEVPQRILSRLFVRGLQFGKTCDQRRQLTLIVEISGYTVEAEKVATQFRFNVYPFCYGPTMPVIVNGHISELAMYPDDPRTRAPVA